MWNGSKFQTFGLRYQTLLASKVTWFMIGTSRLSLYWFQTALLVFLDSKLSFIKAGFKLSSVLKTSIQRFLSPATFVVLLPGSFRIDSYDKL